MDKRSLSRPRAARSAASSASWREIRGLRAIGFAGGAEKCRYVTEELGFDACIDYKSESTPEGLSKR